MRGELGINPVRVALGNNSIRPDFDLEYGYNDLVIEQDNERLYLISEKDWAFILLDAMNIFHEEAEKIIKQVEHDVESCKKENKKVRIIELGINDKRIMDIHMGGKDKCKEINGIPVVVTDEDFNLVRCLIDCC